MIKSKEVKAFQTTNIEQALEFAANEKDNTILLPLSDFMDVRSGLVFKDDKYITSRFGKLGFNSAGLYEFCRFLGLPHAFLQELNQKNLSSKVINDVLHKETKRDKLKAMNFVYNKGDNTITGLVSSTYVGYSNFTALMDIEILELIKDFKLESAEFFNTKMYIKLISDIECENKAFPDKSKKDITKIGLAFQNSMVGGSAVKFSYYFHRLLCSNGLITQASNSEISVVYHAGNLDSFKQRMTSRVISKTKDLIKKKDFIEDLMKIPFNVDKFYSLHGFKQLERFGLISRDEQNKRNQDDYERILENIIDEQKWSRVVFNSLYREKTTMFDLVNVFTEKANKQKLSRKNEMQEDAGKLASWIIEHAEKFK